MAKGGQHYKNPTFLRALGEHCKAIRIKKGYSIDRMAREGDQLSAGTIHRLETGLGDVQSTALFRYAQVLRIPMRRLFEFPMAEHPDGE